MRITALDLATKTGVCYGEAGAKPMFTTWNFSSFKIRGMRALYLNYYLDKHLNEFVPDKIYIERPLNPRTLFEIGTRDETATLLSGLVLVAEMVAAKHGINVDSTITPQVARQHFLGRSKFSERGEGKEVSFRRAKMLEWPVHDLDQADAAALWDLGCARSRPNAWSRAAVERPLRTA